MSSRVPLVLLATLGLILTAALVALALLFLSVPTGWMPFYGFAPDVGAAWAGRWPLPVVRLTPGGFRLAALVLLTTAWAGYAGVCWFSRRLAADDARQGRALRLVVAGAVLAHLALVLTPPTMSKDLYHYALFGQMLVTRGLNPYLHPGDVLAGDPLWQLANWRDLTTHYGPVFTWLSALAAWVGGGGVIATALAFKTLAAAASLAAGWAIWRLARPQGPAAAVGAFALFAWNPVVIVESAGSGHNDFVMLALALWGLVLVREGGAQWRGWAGFGLLVLSVHVKWVTAALAGLVALDHVRAAPGWRARLITAAGLAALAAAVTVALYLPFWAPGSAGLGSTLQLLVEGRRIEQPSGAGTGAGGLASVSVSIWQLGLLAAFLVSVVLAMVVVWRRGQALLLEMSAVVSLAFVLAVFGWVFPWYLLPALAFLAVGPRQGLNRALLALLVTGMVTLGAGWANLSAGISR
jgi:hypothetical protein